MAVIAGSVNSLNALTQLYRNVSVNITRRNISSIKVFLRQQIQEERVMYMITLSVAHRLQLVGRDAAKDCPQAELALVTAQILYIYFHKSNKKLELLSKYRYYTLNLMATFVDWWKLNPLAGYPTVRLLEDY